VTTEFLLSAVLLAGPFFDSKSVRRANRRPAPWGSGSHDLHVVAPTTTPAVLPCRNPGPYESSGRNPASNLSKELAHPGDVLCAAPRLEEKFATGGPRDIRRACFLWPSGPRPATNGCSPSFSTSALTGRDAGGTRESGRPEVRCAGPSTGAGRATRIDVLQVIAQGVTRLCGRLCQDGSNGPYRLSPCHGGLKYLTGSPGRLRTGLVRGPPLLGMRNNQSMGPRGVINRWCLGAGFGDFLLLEPGILPKRRRADRALDP